MRLASISITADLLTHILTNGEHLDGFVVEGGLPPGAKFVHSRWDGIAECVRLVYEHSSFPKGEIYLSPRIRRMK